MTITLPMHSIGVNAAPTPTPSPSPSPSAAPPSAFSNLSDTNPYRNLQNVKPADVIQNTQNALNENNPYRNLQNVKPADVIQNTQNALNENNPYRKLVDRKPAVVEDDSMPNLAPCEDEALKEIYTILTNDQNNVFAKMYEITILKLAGKALESGTASIEGFTKKKAKDEETKLKTDQNASQIKNQILQTYEKYGKKKSLEDVSKYFDETMKKFNNSCYFTNSEKMANHNLSDLVMASAVLESNSGMNDADAAILWAVERIQTQSKSANASKISASERVAQYLGTVQGKSGTKEGTDQKIAVFQKEIADSIRSAYDSVKNGLKACLAKQNANCPYCQVLAEEKFKQEVMNVKLIQKGLTQKVLASENTRLAKDLKGKIGEVKFDFGTIVAKDILIADPKRSEEFDCVKKTEKKKNGKQKQKQKQKQKAVEPVIKEIPKVYEIPSNTYIAPAESTRVVLPVQPLLKKNK